MKTPAAALVGVLGLALVREATAQKDPLRWSYNDYGGIGLLQTRTARMADDGRLSFGYVHVAPHQNFHLTFQALPWLEATFRYDIFEREASGDDLYDRSFDTKIRLLKETRQFPEFSVGLQDVLGTGVASGEYLVASKRYYDFDFSLGLGWGRLGSQGDLGNPLKAFGSKFATRSAETGEGGRLRLGDLFSGRDTALFGGVEYITPVDGLRLKLEFTGDAFLKEEAADPAFTHGSRVNLGADYRPAPWISFGAAYEQGEVFMLRTTLSMNAKHTRAMPKKKARSPVLPRRAAARRLEKARMVVANRASRAETPSFFERLMRAGLDIIEIRRTGPDTEILLVPDGTSDQLPRARDVVDKAAARSARSAGPIQVALASEAPDAARVPITPAPTGTTTDRGADEGAVPRPHPKPAMQAEAAAAQPAPSRRTALAMLLRKDLKTVGLDLQALALDPRKVVVHFENKRYRDPALAIGRGIRVIANALPHAVEEIALVLWSRGVETARLSFLRKDLENALAGTGSPQEVWHNVQAAPTTGRVAGGADSLEATRPAFTWSINPTLRQGLFDPDAPYLYQVLAEAGASLRPVRGLDFSGAIGFGLFDNFDRSTRRSDSVLPHVRSDAVDYIKQSRSGGITRLQANYMWNAAPDFFARVTGGYLEWMFGGVSAEILYRPQNVRWAVGMDLHHVRQRKFDQRFGFRDYEVTTGHANLHYDIPFHNYIANLSVGRYLARDWGATFELVRRFNSGMRVGGFFTLTDVPFEKFGEGSFDKGIYLSIPLDIFFTRHTRRRGTYVIRPLTRDGGQRLASKPRLYDVTGAGRLEDIARNWPGFLK